MKVRLIPIAAAGVLVGTLALAPPAEAGHLDWSFGVGFHVGGLHFRIGYGPPGYGHYPGPFFVTTNRLHYPGYGCHGACFRSGPSYYHHAACPLLGFHFGHVGYGPSYYVHNYSPYRSYGRGYYRYPNRAYGYYYRDGYRDRFRSYGGHYYRDRHKHYKHYKHYKGYRDHRHKGRGGGHHYRHDRRGRHYDDDRHGHRDRHYGNDHRGYRGSDRGRDYAQPRRGARHTRPPD